MAWEISWGAETWSLLREALNRMPRERLLEALVQQKVNDSEAVTSAEIEFVENQTKASLSSVPIDLLADRLMENIESHRTCSNGGHEVYLDSEGWFTIKADDLERLAGL